MTAPSETRKYFPVSWEELHRNAKALAWRLLELGPWQGMVAITRGGLVPAAIVARELDIRLIDTVCVAAIIPTTANRAGEETDVMKPPAGSAMARLADHRRSGRYRPHRRVFARCCRSAFRHRLCQAAGTAAGRYLHHRSQPGHLDSISLGYRTAIHAPIPDAAETVKTGTDRFALGIHGGAFGSRKKQTLRHKECLRHILAEGYKGLAKGRSGLDTVAEAARQLENSGLFVAGKGSGPNLCGYFELDASIMDARPDAQEQLRRCAALPSDLCAGAVMEN